MAITTTPSERIGRCTRMRRFFVRFNRSESFVHTRSLVAFTVITSGFEFSVHTARRYSSLDGIFRLTETREIASYRSKHSVLAILHKGRPTREQISMVSLGVTAA